MTTKEAIDSIYAPKGITSVISGLYSGDYSVLPHDKGKNSDLEKANEMVAQYQKSLDNCKSDWSYWSILSDLEYWRAIKKILEAGELVGNDNLPYVAAPNLENSVVMDCIGKVSDFGESVLREAKKFAAMKTEP